MTNKKLILCFLAVFSACTSGDPTAQTEVTAPPPPAGQPGVQEQVEVAPLPAAFSSEDPGVVTITTSFKREPNDEKKVQDPKSGKQVNNYLALLYRGEKVVLLKQQGDFIQARASDEEIGWIKTSAVLPATNLTVATMHEEIKTFARPDFAALNTSRVLEAGALLFVTKTKEPFSEVNYAGTQTAWVLTDKLTTDTNEVEAARLVAKARNLDEKKDAAAKQFWELAKNNFGSTKLMQLIAEKQAQAEVQPAVPASPEQAQQ